MAIYKVLDTHILHDGTLYGPGDTVDLSEEQAGNLRVERLPEAEQEREKLRKLTNKELIGLCESKGIKVEGTPTKGQLLEILLASDAASKKDGQ